MDLWNLYSGMYFNRLFEEQVSNLWRQGKISGEMHPSIGEEAITAGVLAHLIEGDALALDHRGTAAAIMRGIDPGALLDEFIGLPTGLCAGMGGHMHLFSEDHLLASSGIVGASGPAAVGFALAAELLRPGKVAVAFFGEGSLNQGMLLESFNLAQEWQLPVIFVCKDDQWAITTDTNPNVSPVQRAQGFRLPTSSIDGNDLKVVYQTAGKAIRNAREGKGPAFIHATCNHPEGHTLDNQLVRVGRRPLKEGMAITIPLLKSVFKIRGAPIIERIRAMIQTIKMIRRSASHHRPQSSDPLKHARELLIKDQERLDQLEATICAEIGELFSATGSRLTAEDSR
ncbi:MAG: thiamine pyrophosphate-dependent dehydrogenase E1 component subunit alpha [Chloroflexota bacterium]